MWRPKVSDRFVPLPPHPDIDDNTFLFQAYVLVMRRTKHKPPQPSTNIVVVDGKKPSDKFPNNVIK